MYLIPTPTTALNSDAIFLSLMAVYGGPLMVDLTIVGILIVLLATSQCKLVFEDNFTTFNFNTWRHDITMAGGGNWEF
jgi:hypothetical protein